VRRCCHDTRSHSIEQALPLFGITARLACPSLAGDDEFEERLLYFEFVSKILLDGSSDRSKSASSQCAIGDTIDERACAGNQLINSGDEKRMADLDPAESPAGRTFQKVAAMPGRNDREESDARIHSLGAFFRKAENILNLPS
jgi:hypothetical protein